MPYNHAVYTFVETKLFTRLIDEYLTLGAISKTPENGMLPHRENAMISRTRERK